MINVYRCFKTSSKIHFKHLLHACIRVNNNQQDGSNFDKHKQEKCSSKQFTGATENQCARVNK